MVSQKHQRRSIRLKGYDYSQAGGYFITICTQDRRHLFGEIIDGKMVLNVAGEMIEKWYWELENKFPDMQCGEMVIMPNHIHFIITNMGTSVGADLRVCPGIVGEHDTGRHTGLPLQSGRHTGLPLHRVVQWFKTMTTNEYIRGVKSLHWQRFNKRMWQRNYYEHIIRNENEYHRIAQYIHDNPVKWKNDRLNDRNNNDVMESPEKYGREPWMI